MSWSPPTFPGRAGIPSAPRSLNASGEHLPPLPPLVSTPQVGQAKAPLFFPLSISKALPSSPGRVLTTFLCVGQPLLYHSLPQIYCSLAEILNSSPPVLAPIKSTQLTSLKDAGSTLKTLANENRSCCLWSVLWEPVLEQKLVSTPQLDFAKTPE